MTYAALYRETTRPVPARDSLRQAVRSGYLSARSLFYGRGEDRFLRLFYCHYVFDDQVGAFADIIRFLTGMGTFIDTDRAIAMVEGREPIDGRYFHLSFDDGFRNIVTNALPVLRDHGVPAISFVPTAVISAPYDEVEHYCRVTTNYNAVIEMASWDELARAAEEGVLEIGSHTRTHARLSAISGSRAAMDDEIAGSKRDLEARLGRECRYISWPYGRLDDADAVSLELVRDAGYRACFGAFRGPIRPGRTDSFAIPRHHFEAHWPLAHIKCFAHGLKE